MNTETFYLLIALVAIFISFYYNKLRLPDNNKHSDTNIIHVVEKNNTPNYHHDKIYDPLEAPERAYPYRNPTMNINHTTHTMPGIPVNIPTRGETSYSQIGTLTSEDSSGDPVILPLYGKPVYPGSSNWLYYSSTDKFPTIKLPVRSNNKDCLGDQGCREITDTDEITINAYNDRTFSVNIYNIDRPRYIPYI
jgi:hypothetical protein